MKNFLFILFILYSNTFYSQVIYTKFSGFSDTLKQEHKINSRKLRDHIFKGIPNNYKEGLFERMSYVFSDNSSFKVKQIMSDGSIYNNWLELEDYLNQILKKVMPAELSNDSVIHVYIMQEGEYNAFMTPSGQLFLNVGVFSEVYNEAQIASIFAHELAHYYLKHAIKYYIETETGGFSGKVFNDKLSNSYSRKLENESDSLAFLWLNNSGYNTRSLLFVYQTLDRIETNMLSLSPDLKKIKDNTHPTAKERISRMEEWIEKKKPDEGQYFIVNEDLFFVLKEKTKPEILKAYFNDFDYYKCLEQAFKFHLFNPDDIVFVNYILECIRRICYLNVNVGKEYFITNRYFEEYDYGGAIRKRPINTHLFSSFNFTILYMDIRVAGQINAKFYWKDKPRFTTYNEAFDFYYKLSRALNDKECILSYSLKCNNDTLKRDSLLRLYLSFSDILYREYADSLMQNKLINSFKKRKVTVLSEMVLCVRIGEDDLFIEKTETTDEIKQLFDTIMTNNKNSLSIYLPDIMYNHLSQFKVYKDIEDFSLTRTYAKGTRTEFYILCPEYWDIYRLLNVDEIEFLNCIYTFNVPKPKSDNEIDFFKKCSNLSYHEILSVTGNTKYLDIMISSVRMKKERTMKVRYINDNPMLKYNETGYKEIVEKINYSFIDKEKKSDNNDHFYRKYN